MTTEEKIIAKESELVAIRTKIQESDKYANKCSKLGTNFQEEYPTQYAEYTQALQDFDTADAELQELYEQHRREEEERQHPVEEGGEQ